jgi:hypothetical protein
VRAASCSTRWTGRRCIESRAACSKIAQICFKCWFSVVPLRIHMGRIQPKAIPTHLLRCQLTTLHLSDRPPPEHPSATHPTTPRRSGPPNPPSMPYSSSFSPRLHGIPGPAQPKFRKACHIGHSLSNSVTSAPPLINLCTIAALIPDLCAKRHTSEGKRTRLS